MEDTQTLTDEQLYEVILQNREKKKSKQSKIFSALTLGIVFVVVLVFMILALVPTCYAPKFLTIKPDKIVFNDSGISTSSASYEKDSAKYNSIMSQVLDSFTQSTLGGIFSSRSGDYKFSNSTGDSSFSSTSSTFSGLTNVLVYVFDEDQDFVDNNGNQVYSTTPINSSIKITYNMVFFSIGDADDIEDEITDLTVYVVYQKGTDTDSTYYTTFTFKANTYDLCQQFANGDYDI